MNQAHNNNGDQRLAEMLEVIFRFAAGDLTARGTLSDDDSALDGVMAGINILGEELEVQVAENKRALEYANTLIRSSPDGVLAVDLDLRITEWNLLMEQMCGMSREQAIGQNLAEIRFMKETGEAARIRAGLEGKGAASMEVVYRIPGEDKERFFESIMAPLRGPAGEILGAVLRIRDITERKLAHQVLLDSEDRLRAIFDSMQDGIIVVETRTRRYRMVNAAICRMLGYSADELLKLGLEDIHPEKSLVYVTSQFEQLAKGEISVASNLPMKRKDRSIFYADVNSGPMMLDRVACLVCVFRDITERRQAQQALSESEALLRRVFDTVQEGIVMTDARTRRFQMVNNSICRMLGYRRNELLELGVEDIHPEEELANVIRQIERQIKGEISIAANLPVKRKDGTIFYADINATPMEVKGITFLLGVFRDITGLKRAEEAEERASRDSLTDLYNHRTFYSLLKDEIARTQRFKLAVSLLMLDIDYFRRVNDTYGHEAGDVVLKGMSDLLVKHARTVDSVCRYGGEKITVILPGTDAIGAMEIAERLRAAVESEPFAISGGKTINITVSIGVATYPQQVNSLEELVKAAAVALYTAKQGGRNRTCRYETEMTVTGAGQ